MDLKLLVVSCTATDGITRKMEKWMHAVQFFTEIFA